MTSASHVEMHRQHLAWKSDDDFWREELALWQREVEQVISESRQIEASLREHAQKLDRHAASIRLYEQDFAKHEHTLVDFEQGETPAELIELALTHKREAEKHSERRTAHEDVKRRHHALITKWRQALGTLTELQELGSDGNSTPNG